MPKFDVLIIETLTKSVTVEAENEDEAFWKVRDGWRREEYILYPDNFLCVEFETRSLEKFDEDNLYCFAVPRRDINGNIQGLPESFKQTPLR